MTVDEAITFLVRHQPLPDDPLLDEHTLLQYDEARKALLIASDVRAIPLLLNSFGDGSGFGVYQLIEDVILAYDSDAVILHLVDALNSPHRGVRYWCAQIAQNYTDLRLLPKLMTLTSDGDDDIRDAANTALTNYR